MGCPKSQIVEVTRPCIAEPPPPKPLVKSVPCDLDLCFSNPDAAALVAWYMNLWAWAQTNYRTCKE